MKNYQFISLPKGISDEVIVTEKNFNNWLNFSNLKFEDFIEQITPANFSISHFLDIETNNFYVKLPVGESFVGNLDNAASLYEMIFLLMYIGNKLDNSKQSVLNVKKNHYYTDIIEEYIKRENVFSDIISKGKN